MMNDGFMQTPQNQMQSNYRENKKVEKMTSIKKIEDHVHL
jgi:hypothetical protein